MRVSKAKAAENRERILTEAARLFREHGLSGVGVDALTHAAGLTHGSLYSQFGSKDRLAEAALNHALSSGATRMGDAETLEQYAARYLSEDHRDRRGDGCVLAALVGEMPRQTGNIRHDFTDAVRALASRISTFMPDRHDGDDGALVVVAALLGALTLARAVDDPNLSDRILAATREHLRSIEAAIIRDLETQRAS